MNASPTRPDYQIEMEINQKNAALDDIRAELKTLVAGVSEEIDGEIEALEDEMDEIEGEIEALEDELDAE